MDESISVKTIETHRLNISENPEIKNMAELVNTPCKAKVSFQLHTFFIDKKNTFL
jgi:FixJ family two-component response regulator